MSNLPSCGANFNLRVRNKIFHLTVVVFNAIWFRLILPQAAVMDFIARMPPKHHYPLPAGGSICYGMFISQHMVEYLTNEFTIHSFESVTLGDVKKLLLKSECKVWRNDELPDFDFHQQ